MPVDYALSRIIAYVEPMSLKKELEFKQLLDSRLKATAEDLEFSSHDKFELIDGLFYSKMCG